MRGGTKQGAVGISIESQVYQVGAVTSATCTLILTIET